MTKNTYPKEPTDLSGEEIGEASRICEERAQAVFDDRVLPPAFGPYEGETFLVPTRDGVRLAIDVYLPSGQGPFPSVLYRTPYDRRYDIPELALNYLDSGIAVVTQDLRGRSPVGGMPSRHERFLRLRSREPVAHYLRFQPHPRLGAL